MRCYSCGGRLEGMMKPCPYCGVRPVIYLPQPIFRDTPDPNPSANPMPCPSCGTSLGIIEMISEERVTNMVKNFVGVLAFLAYIVLRMLR